MGARLLPGFPVSWGSRAVGGRRRRITPFLAVALEVRPNLVGVEAWPVTHADWDELAIVNQAVDRLLRDVQRSAETADGE